MKHSINSLDSKQIEKLLITFTIEELAKYYNVCTSTVSEYITNEFKKNKLNRPVEVVGAWMDSEERKALKNASKKDEWLILKETNLYKQLKNKYERIKN